MLEADRIRTRRLTYDELRTAPGVLGLMPSMLGSKTKQPNPFVSAVEQQLLRRNMFGLRLTEPQYLTMGGVNASLFEGDIRYVPLTNATSDHRMPGLAGAWQTRMDAIAVNGVGLRMPLPGFAASFSSVDSFVRIPEDEAFYLLQILGFEAGTPMLPPTVACDARENMLDIEITLAGRVFHLTAFGYTLEWRFEDDEVRCVSAISPLDPEMHEVILGTPFLRRYYSVFGFGERRIGCKYFQAQDNTQLTCSSCGAFLVSQTVHATHELAILKRSRAPWSPNY